MTSGFEAFLLLLVALLLSSASCPLVQAESTTDAPTPGPLDNTVVDIFYVDVILSFTHVDDFAGRDQTQWRFLKRLCGIEPIRRDYYRQYPFNRGPPAVDSYRDPSDLRCQISSRPGSIALPTVQVRYSARGLAVLPYLNDQYLVTLVFRGTAWKLENFTKSVQETEREAMSVLGVVEISPKYDPSDVYSEYGVVTLTVDEKATLSLAWHLIIVSFFALVVGVGVTFYGRNSSNLKNDQSAKDPAMDNEDNLDDDGIDEEALLRAQQRWQERELEDEKEELIGEAIEDSNPVANMAATSYCPTTATGIAPYSPSRTGSGAAGGMKRSAPLGSERDRKQKAKTLRYSNLAFEEAMALEPALNLPPESAVVRSTQAIAKLKAEKERGTKKKRTDEKEHPLLELPSESLTLLPPEAEELEEQERKEKLIREAPMMGLAARRMAAAMTTLAVTDAMSSSRTGSSRRGTVGLMRGAMLAPSRRRLFSSIDGARPDASVSGSALGTPLTAGVDNTEMGAQDIELLALEGETTSTGVANVDGQFEETATGVPSLDLDSPPQQATKARGGSEPDPTLL